MGTNDLRGYKLIGMYYRSVTDMGKLEQMIHDVWRQHPIWPSTYSSCAAEDCDETARGGSLCKKCVQEAMIALVGCPEAVAKYVEAVSNERLNRFALMGLLPQPPEA